MPMTHAPDILSIIHNIHKCIENSILKELSGDSF